MVGTISQLKGNPITHPDALNATMKVLVSQSEGWVDHVMRVIEVEAGGYTPKHAHVWSHINYIISGTGLLFLDGVEHPVAAGSYAFVPGNALHQFRNTGNTLFQFICIVPKEGHPSSAK